MHHFSLEPAICFQRSINLKLYHQLLVFFALPNHLLNLDHQHLIFRSCLSSVYSASMIFSLPSTPLLWQDKYFLETLDESPLHLHSLTLVNPLCYFITAAAFLNQPWIYLSTRKTIQSKLSKVITRSPPIIIQHDTII